MSEYADKIGKGDPHRRQILSDFAEVTSMEVIIEMIKEGGGTREFESKEALREYSTRFAEKVTERMMDLCPKRRPPMSSEVN